MTKVGGEDGGSATPAAEPAPHDPPTWRENALVGLQLACIVLIVTLMLFVLIRHVYRQWNGEDERSCPSRILAPLTHPGAEE